MNDLLTDAEVIELTGATRPSKQAEILDKNGIYYIQRIDKTIRVTWHHVHNPHKQTASTDEKPDFDAIDKAS